MMKTFLVAFVLLYAAAPVAAGDSEICESPVILTYACVGGAATGTPGCEEPGSSSAEYNEVYILAVAADVWIMGAKACWNDEDGYRGLDAIIIHSCSYGCTGFQWYEWSYEDHAECDMYVSAILVGHSFGCPIGSPGDYNPGWGHMGFLPEDGPPVPHVPFG